MQQLRLEQYRRRKLMGCEAEIERRVERYARIVSLGIALFE